MAVTSEGIKLIESNESCLRVEIIRKDTTQVFFDVDFETKLRQLVDDEDYLVIVDEQVAEIHADKFKNMKTVELRAGDKYKNQVAIDKIIDAAIANKISRTGYFVGVGGGTITDMVGYAACTYFRGIKYINVPTSLLGMVDAAIGGKTAINHIYQKNMIGSFYHPTYILYDYTFLRTLDQRNFRNGFGEIIKVSLISKNRHLQNLQRASDSSRSIDAFTKDVIRNVAKDKLRLLGENCFERDLKRPLNLGHTIAHPLEDITDFRVLHGEAVAFGCLFAAQISYLRGSLKQSDLERLRATIDKFNLLYQINQISIDRDELWERLQRLIMQRGGKGLLYVLPVSGSEMVEITNNIALKEFDYAYDKLTAI